MYSRIATLGAGGGVVKKIVVLVDMYKKVRDPTPPHQIGSRGTTTTLFFLIVAESTATFFF